MFEKGSTVLYEIFNNLLSGIPIIIAFYVYTDGLSDVLIQLGKVNYVVLIGTAYILGTVVHSASNLIYSVAFRKGQSKKDKSEKHVVIRKKDKENWHYIEKWYTLSNSYLSLSLSLTLGFIIVLISNIRVSFWIILITVISVILLIIQSIRYNRWAKRDLDNAYLKIDNYGE